MIPTRSKYKLSVLHTFLLIPGLLIYGLKSGIDSTPSAPPFSELDSLVWYGIPEDMILFDHESIPAWPKVNAFTSNEELIIIPTAKYLSTPCGEILERMWTAYNLSGKTTTRTQTTLFLRDHNLLFKSPNDTIIQCGEGIPKPPYQTLQSCGDFKITLSEKIEAENACTYSLLRTWHLGNTSTFSSQYTQHIKVVDTVPPSITVVNPLYRLFPDGGELAMFGDERPEFYESDVEIRDDCCDPDLQINYDLLEEATSGIMGPYRRWQVTFVATDLSLNSSTFSLNIMQYDARNQP